MSKNRSFRVRKREKPHKSTVTAHERVKMACPRIDSPSVGAEANHTHAVVIALKRGIIEL